jgi:uncharacterized protein Yka (UPF0111/DUF47 family)
MLKHPDSEVQFLVEMLEGQRDQAVAQAAAFFRTMKELERQIDEMKADTSKSLDEDCQGLEKIGGTD